MSSGDPPPTGLLHRFGLIIEAVKRAVVRAAEHDRTLATPLTAVLWNSLARRMRLLAMLHARFTAGLLAEPRPRPRPRPAPGESAGPEPIRARRDRLPRGAVLVRYGASHQQAALMELLDDPEFQALLAATPRAGRLLRPLWRMLTSDPLPEMLLLPPRPPRPRPRARSLARSLARPALAAPAVSRRRLPPWAVRPPDYTPDRIPRPAAPLRPPKFQLG